MDGPREREIKLELDPADWPALTKHPLLRSLARRPAKRLVSVYFDTTDESLRRSGLSLRVRWQDGHYVQTVKSAGEAAGWFDRSEWEQDVAEPSPDRTALRATPAAGALKRGGVAALKPLFEASVERRTRRLSLGGAVIELTLDQGRLDSGSASLDLCEVELELKNGPAEVLFKVAEDLSAVVPLRPAVRSKSERGYALGGNELDTVVKAGKVPLRDDLSAAEGFRAIAGACFKHFRLNEAALMRSRETEALHQTRVAVRRLRSAFSLFADLLADERFEAIKGNLKRISEPLGRARNLDVFLGTIMPQEIERRPDEPELHDIAAVAQKQREAAYDVVTAELGSPDWCRREVGLVAWIEAGSWTRTEDPMALARLDQPLTSFAAQAISDRLRKVKRKGRHLDRLSPHARHRVRIQAKKLRYAVEFFEALYTRDKKSRRRYKAFIASLERLQAKLGDLNDIASAHGIAADLARTAGLPAPVSFAAGEVAADQDGRTDRLLASAAKAHARLGAAERFW